MADRGDAELRGTDVSRRRHTSLPHASVTGPVAAKAGERLLICSIPVSIPAHPADRGARKSRRLPDELRFTVPKVFDSAIASQPEVISVEPLNQPGLAPADQADRQTAADERRCDGCGPHTLPKVRRTLMVEIPLPGRPAVHCGTAALARQAHIRRARRTENVRTGEVQEYLSVAERSRGVRPGNGEILAFFSRVPIELISKWRFDECSRLLAFTLTPLRGIAQSRVHDLAVVRDEASGRILLIPHPTAFQAVALQ